MQGQKLIVAVEFVFDTYKVEATPTPSCNLRHACIKLTKNCSTHSKDSHDFRNSFSDLSEASALLDANPFLFEMQGTLKPYPNPTRKSRTQSCVS